MSNRLIVKCDICGAELELKASAPLDSYQYERELNLEGWWQRPDFDEICPSHPKPAAVARYEYGRRATEAAALGAAVNDSSTEAKP